MQATYGHVMHQVRQTLIFSRNPNLPCERSETDFNTQPGRLQRPSHAGGETDFNVYDQCDDSGELKLSQAKQTCRAWLFYGFVNQL